MGNKHGFSRRTRDIEEKFSLDPSDRLAATKRLRSAEAAAGLTDEIRNNGLGFENRLRALEAAPVGPDVLHYWRFENGVADAEANDPGSILDSVGGLHGSPHPTIGPVYRADVFGTPVPSTGEANTLSLEIKDLTSSGGAYVAFTGQFPFNVGQGDKTIEFWFRSDFIHNGMIVFGRADAVNAANYWAINVNFDTSISMHYTSPSGVFHQVIGGVSENGIGDGFFVGGSWHHVAVTRSGNLYKGYGDGVEYFSVTDMAPDLPDASGWRWNGRPSNQPFLGGIDEMRITNEALLPSQFLNAP